MKSDIGKTTTMSGFVEDLPDLTISTMSLMGYLALFMEILQLWGFPLAPHIPWERPFQYLQTPLYFTHIPVWDEKLVGDRRVTEVVFWVYGLLLVTMYLVMLGLVIDTHFMHRVTLRSWLQALYRHYVSISSVLFIPALRVFAAVGAHGLAPSSALVGVRFVALLFSLLLVGGAVFAAAIVYCITPPPYSSTVLAKAHGRVDLLLVLFKATLAVVVTPGQWSWFASGFAIVCPLGIAGLYVYLQPYYSSGMQEFVIAYLAVFAALSIAAVPLTYFPATIPPLAVTIACAVALPLAVLLGWRLCEQRRNPCRPVLTTQQLPDTGLYPKLKPLGHRNARNITRAQEYSQVEPCPENESFGVAFEEPIWLPVSPKAASDDPSPGVNPLNPRGSPYTGQRGALMPLIQSLRMPIEVELSTRFVLLVAQHGAVPRATEEFVQRFANSIFARGRAVFPDSQMLRIHSALMLTLSRNVQESVAVLDRLNTRIQWPDVRYQRLQIMRLNNVLSGITSHEKTYWARIIDSVSCKLLKAMRELWDLLLMGDGRESASFHSIMHLIHGYRQEAQKAFGEILQQEEGQWSLQLWANFHEIALMNTTAAEQAYRQIEYLDALRAEKSYSGTASSGRSVYQGDLFANLKRTKLYEKRQTVLTSATVPLLLLFLLLVVDYVFFWGFVHNIQFQLECLPKLGEVAKLVQECGARVQGRNGTDTESLLVISDRLQVLHGEMAAGRNGQLGAFFEGRSVPVTYFDAQLNRLNSDVVTPAQLLILLTGKCRNVGDLVLYSDVVNSSATESLYRSARSFVLYNVPTAAAFAFNISAHIEAANAARLVDGYTVVQRILGTLVVILLLCSIGMYNLTLQRIAVDSFMTFYLFQLLPKEEVRKLRTTAAKNLDLVNQKSLSAAKDQNEGGFTPHFEVFGCSDEGKSHASGDVRPTDPREKHGSVSPESSAIPKSSSFASSPSGRNRQSPEGFDTQGGGDGLLMPPQPRAPKPSADGEPVNPGMDSLAPATTTNGGTECSEFQEWASGPFDQHRSPINGAERDAKSKEFDGSKSDGSGYTGEEEPSAFGSSNMTGSFHSSRTIARLLIVQLLLTAAIAVLAMLVTGGVTSSLHTVHHTTTEVFTQVKLLREEATDRMIFARSFAQTLSARSYNRYLEIWRRNSLQMITNRLIEFDLAFEMTAAGHIQTTNSIDALRRLMNQLQRKELTSMRMTVTAHDGDITRFPEIQNHTWDESETRDFDWNGYKHFGFDWNSTRDLTGLHATDAAYDLQLPKPRLKRLAISILVDDHYDAVRAECMEILRQLMAKMNEILQRDTTYYISQLRTLLVPALILLGLHLVLSVVLITATAKVLIQPRMWLVMALLILQGLMCGAVMTVMLFYWNVWSTWDAVTTQQLAAYDMHARFFRDCSRMTVYSRKFTQFADLRAYLRWAALVGMDRMMQQRDELEAALGPATASELLDGAVEKCDWMQHRQYIAMALAARGAAVDPALVPKFQNLTWDREQDEDVQWQRERFPAADIPYTNSAADSELPPDEQVDKARVMLTDVVYDYQYFAYEKISFQMLEAIRDSGTTVIHAQVAASDLLGHLLIIFPAVWLVVNIITLMLLGDSTLVNRMGAVRRAAVVQSLLHRYRVISRFAFSLVTLGVACAFAFFWSGATLFSLPLLTYKPCNVNWRLASSLLFAREVLYTRESNATAMLGHDARTELQRIATQLQGAIHDMHYGYEFGYIPGHQRDPAYTIPVPPLLGAYRTVDNMFFGDKKLDARLRRWVELIESVAFRPMFMEASETAVQELMDLYPDLTAEFHEICKVATEMSVQEVQELQPISIAVVVGLTLLFLVVHFAALRPTLLRLRSEEDAAVDMLLVVPEDVREQIPAIKDYLEFGHLQTEQSNLRNALIKNEKLVSNVFPSAISQRIKMGEYPIADPYPDVAIMFSGLVGFTRLAKQISAQGLVRFLNDLYEQYDALMEARGLQKIKTIGDAYFCVGNCAQPLDNAPLVTVEAAVEMMEQLKALRSTKTYRAWRHIEQRIGLHVGPVVGGVIGRTVMSYDLWGDAVNVASRMCSTGVSGSIQMSADFYSCVRSSFPQAQPREVVVKGKGQNFQTYTLTPSFPLEGASSRQQRESDGYDDLYMMEDNR